MTTIEVCMYTANPGDYATPYIKGQEPIEYICDGKEGSILFDGYYYVEDTSPPYPEDNDPNLKPWERPRRHSEWLPKKCMMFMTRRETEPSKEEYDEETFVTRVFYNILEKQQYVIEIYKRDIHDCTDVISQIEDNGSPMDVCFFPTNKQTIYFRVLEEIKVDNSVKIDS